MIENEKTTVDGGEIEFISKDTKTSELEDKFNLKGGYKKAFLFNFAFVSKNDKFSMGMQKMNSGRRIFIVVMKINGFLHRVHIENVRCKSCGWTGLGANPTVPDLYLGVEDWHSHLAQSWKIDFVSCPICSTKFERPYIWVGDE